MHDVIQRLFMYGTSIINGDVGLLLELTSCCLIVEYRECTVSGSLFYG